MVTHSSVFLSENPMTEDPGGLQSTGRVLKRPDTTDTCYTCSVVSQVAQG